MNLEEFIKTRLESVDDLRTLLLFKGSPDAEMNANEIAGKLYLPPAKVAQVLARLAARGLLAASGEAKCYRYRPDSPETALRVSELVKLDRERPVSLIKMIYPRTGDIQAFADAFRIKKEKEKEN